jgi:hypothetical protein
MGTQYGALPASGTTGARFIILLFYMAAFWFSPVIPPDWSTKSCLVHALGG